MKKFYLSTTGDNYEKNAADSKFGIELAFFCIAENLSGERLKECCSKIDRLMENSSLTGEDMIIHAPFNELYPAAIDPEAKKLIKKRMDQTYDICRRFGIGRMVVHSGYMPKVYFKSWHIDRSAEFWTEFMRDKPADFEIYIENVLEDEPYMMAELMKKIRTLSDDRAGSARKVPFANIKVCLDIGHANCVSDIGVNEWIDVLAPYIGHFHIHNNDGEHDYHLNFDEGTMDVAELLYYGLAVCSPETTFTSEVINGDAAAAWLNTFRRKRLPWGKSDLT